MSDPHKSPFATVDPTVDPYTGQTLAEFPAVEGAEVDAALELAAEAFEAWRERPIAQRADIVGRTAELMRERKEELAALITLEMGKLIAEARGEVDLAASILEYYARRGPGFAADEPLDVAEGEAYLVTEPLGVLLGVMPWNFPLYQMVRFAGPNLVLGNGVLVKHAGSCPQSALALESLFHDAGAPEGVYTNLFVSHDEVGRIIGSPIVRGASLTGSEKAGAEVAERAGRNMKPSLLELGGSDAFIVLDGAHLERTVAAAVAGRMANTGQSCVAAKRFIVLDEVHDAFVDGLRHAFEALRPGDPADEATTLGPLSSERAASDQVRAFGAEHAIATEAWSLRAVSSTAEGREPHSTRAPDSTRAPPVAPGRRGSPAPVRPAPVREAGRAIRLRGPGAVRAGRCPVS